MSMTADDRIPSVTEVEAAPAALKLPRRSGSQFIALSDLANERFTPRDLLPLLPATLISLIFNALFVTILFLTNAGPSVATPTKKIVLNESDTKLQDVKKEDDFIVESDPLIDPTMNVDAQIKLPGEDPKLDAEPGLVTPPTADAPSGVGKGNEGGIQGADAPTGAPGIPGSYLENADYGFKGDQGAGPMGDGMGLPGAGGAGPSTAGGFGPRNAKDLLAIAKSQGGSDESERAVGRGLEWLKKHQWPDGRWSLDKYHLHSLGCKCRDANIEGSVQSNDTAGTALGLLPFLGAGHTHKKTNSPYHKIVLGGLQHLTTKQGSNGDLGGGMYSHALAALALCEAYAMTSDPKLRMPAQRSIQFIEYAQNPTTGGWRYQPRTDGDTSVVAWQVMALRSAQMAGLTVNSRTLDLARKWLDSCQKEMGTQYSYTPDVGPTYPMTAAALLNRQYMGWGPRKPELHKGCEFLLKNLPPAKGRPKEPLGPIYYYYYASQVMHHMGDKYWDTWNPLMRDLLIRTQETEGHQLGSWNPNGADHGNAGGRMYSTSLAIMTLEVYYRHLPLYRRESASKEMEVEAPDDKKPEMKKDDPKKETPKDEMKKDEPKKEEMKKDDAKKGEEKKEGASKFAESR